MAGDQPSSWRDWIAFPAPGTVSPSTRRALPDPQLVTRQELLAIVERWGVRGVNERNLRYWERQALLPQATIDRGLGRARAVYPWWVADLVSLLRQYQDRGLSVLQLRERMRVETRRLSLLPFVPRGGRGSAPPWDFPYTPTPIPELTRLAMGDMSTPLAILVAIHREALGIPIVGVDLVLHTEAGERLVYTVPLHEGGQEQ